MYNFMMAILTQWPMIILCVVALARCKNGKPWIWYCAGCVISLLAFFGHWKSYNATADDLCKYDMLNNTDAYTKATDILRYGIFAIILLAAIFAYFIVMLKKRYEKKRLQALMDDSE